MIGGLQYLTHTRSDIANAIGIVARFQADPKEAHYTAIKKKDFISQSTIEEKYVAKTNNFNQVVWIKKIHHACIHQTMQSLKLIGYYQINLQKCEHET